MTTPALFVCLGFSVIALLLRFAFGAILGAMAKTGREYGVVGRIVLLLAPVLEAAVNQVDGVVQKASIYRNAAVEAA